mmetsp:Transcript_42164/g.59213  ORF Transcript_42164/g.59213 Transcript_42164/m.59213 type:complete len:140 (+) Transcript_42164:131-550(+)
MKEREALASKLLAKESRKDRHQNKRPMAKFNLATSQEEQQQPKEVSLVSKSSILRGPPTKKQKVKKYDPSKNFLGIGAQKAKAARTARKAAKVGFRRGSRVNKLSNTGTGIPLNEVVRFKYQKGFTQAVKTPCRMEDLM